MADLIRLAAGRRYELPTGDSVMALPAHAPRSAPFNDCTWLLFGATANYAVISDGSIRMTMTAGGEGVIHLGPERGWSTGLRVADLRPAA